MLDPFAPLRYLGMVIAFWVRRVGWKWILVGWAGATVLVVVLNYTT